MNRTKVEIATTAFNGEGTINAFFDSIYNLTLNCITPAEFSVVIIDDGSTDKTWQHIIYNIGKYPSLNIRAYRHLKNVGHHSSLIEALKITHDESQLVFLIDSDGEEDPLEFNNFFTQLTPNTYSIIGYEKNRTDRNLIKLLGFLAWKIINSLSRANVPANICTVRLLRKDYIKYFRQFKVSSPVLWIIHNKIGLPTKYIAVTKTRKRFTTYTFKKRLRLFIRMILNDYELVTKFVISLGILGVLISSTSIVYFIIYKIFINNSLPGYTSIGILISFSVGVILLIEALIVLMMKKTYEQICYSDPILLKHGEE